MAGTIAVDPSYRPPTTETSNATPVQIVGMLVPENSIAVADFTVKAIATVDGTSAAWRISGAAKRGVGDAIAVGGIYNNSVKDTAAAAWALTAGVSGEYIILTATGDAAKLVKWYVSGNYEAEPTVAP